MENTPEILQTPEIPQTTHTLEEIPVPITAPLRSAKTTASKPKTAPRTTDELMTLDPKKLTEAEKLRVIKCYQETIHALKTEHDIFKSNAMGAFEQARVLRQRNEQLEKEARVKINLLKQNINMLYQNALLVDMED